jgi:hypothetical protein
VVLIQSFKRALKKDLKDPWMKRNFSEDSGFGLCLFWQPVLWTLDFPRHTHCSTSQFIAISIFILVPLWYVSCWYRREGTVVPGAVYGSGILNPLEWGARVGGVSILDTRSFIKSVKRFYLRGKGWFTLTTWIKFNRVINMSMVQLFKIIQIF